METGNDTTSQREVVGLIPAAGRASRIAPLPCSKELYPIGFRTVDGAMDRHPKVVSHYLLEKMRLAGISKGFVVVREGKWDIPTYLQDGSALDMHLAYLMMGLPFGVPYTIDQAFQFVRHATVAFGFPDILFQPNDAFVQLLRLPCDADILLGLFPTDSPEKEDLVDFDDAGRVRRIVIRPPQTRLRNTWGIAVWNPTFTQFLHDYLVVRKSLASEQPELSMGDAIQAAIDSRLRVDAVPVSDKPYLDIGTPENLVKALRSFADQ